MLRGVAGVTTQWSAVYGMSDGSVQVVMGGRYDSPHSFFLPPALSHR